MPVAVEKRIVERWLPGYGERPLAHPLPSLAKRPV